MVRQSLIILLLVIVTRILVSSMAADGLETLNLVTLELAINAPCLGVLNRRLTSTLLSPTLLIVLLLHLLVALVLVVVSRIVASSITTSNLRVTKIITDTFTVITTSLEDVILLLLSHIGNLMFMVTFWWRLITITTNLVLVVLDGANAARTMMNLLLRLLLDLRKRRSHPAISTFYRFTIRLLLLLISLHIKG